MTELETIAKKVVEARISLGWSQMELANKAFVGLSTLQKIEQGRAPMASPLTMQKLAIALGKRWDPERATFTAAPVPRREVVGTRTFTVTVPPTIYDVIDRIAQEQNIPMEEAAQEWADSLDRRPPVPNIPGLQTGAQLDPTRQAASRSDAAQARVDEKKKRKGGGGATA